MWSRQLLFWFTHDFERRKRMLKSRWMSGLIALALVLTFAQSGLAQIQISVTGNASPNETETNITADTNDPVSGGTLFILGTSLSDADVSIGGLRISYPVAITSTESFPAGDPIAVLSATGFFSTVGTDDIVINYEEGTLEIDLPNSLTAQVNGDTGTISIGGIRIDASDADPDESVDASVALFVGDTDGSDDQVNIATGPSNINVNLQTSTIEVITNLEPGIEEVDINNELIISTTGADLEDGRIDIVEGHAAAWWDSTDLPGALNDAGLRLVFEGIPDGLEIDLTVNTGGDIDSFTITPATVDADDNEAVITWNAGFEPDPEERRNPYQRPA
jgi:hypothetical protein